MVFGFRKFDLNQLLREDLGILLAIPDFADFPPLWALWISRRKIKGHSGGITKTLHLEKDLFRNKTFQINFDLHFRIISCRIHVHIVHWFLLFQILQVIQQDLTWNIHGNVGTMKSSNEILRIILPLLHIEIQEWNSPRNCDP